MSILGKWTPRTSLRASVLCSFCARTHRAMSVASVVPLSQQRPLLVITASGPTNFGSGFQRFAKFSLSVLRKTSPFVGGLTGLSAAFLLAERHRRGRSTPFTFFSQWTGGDVRTDGPSTVGEEREVGEQGPAVADKQQHCSEGDQQKLILRTGAAMLPHPDKTHKGGEDSFFIGDNGQSLGVADGVGGWADMGIDAGEYARLLMSSAKRASARYPPGPSAPQRILEAAHVLTTVRGSSTACILVLHGQQLYASNLGDSGFLVVRNGEVVFQSPQQQHAFNYPFQLGSLGTASDSPADAQALSVRVKEGDVLITGTDGLFDNVFPDEACAIVRAAKSKGEAPKVAAQALTTFARMRAADRVHMSPFSYAAMAMGYAHMGGKMDDITVLVSYVEVAGELPTQNGSSAGSEDGGGSSPPTAKL